MNILFPGRHHLLTDFQFKYLYTIIQTGLKNVSDINGNLINITEKIDSIIFAVTSANHSNTRRNPLPLYLRAMAIQEFALGLNIDSYIFAIDDVGHLNNFADYTLKRIKHESGGKLNLNPKNTVVLCSTEVYKNYEDLRFKILPAELIDKEKFTYQSELPWEIVEKIAYGKNEWIKDKNFIEKTHPSSYKLWKTYNIGDKVKLLFNDNIIGEDGDITKTRDYNSYVRQMDDIAELKYKDTAPYIKKGRIGDIGCAVGSWIKLASFDKRFNECDFYGIEVARKLFTICEQRKNNGEFMSPYVFFSQKNAVTGLVFDAGSMNTIHTSSLTHEIESYGSRDDLLKFIKNRFDELTNKGVWINRDVVGPIDKEKVIYMEIEKVSGRNNDYDKTFENSKELEDYLAGLSTYARFLRFCLDFRKKQNYQVHYSIEKINDKELIKLSLKDATEFMTKKDYIDNWNSEMNETFCFWSFSQWCENLTNVGFKINELSNSYTNEWIVKNRFKNKVTLYELKGKELIEIPYPVTNMLLIAEKID